MRGSVVCFWRRHQNSRDSNLALLSSEKSIGCTCTNDTSLNLRASCCQRNFSHLVRFAVSSLIMKERNATHRIRQSLKHPWVQRSFRPLHTQRCSICHKKAICIGPCLASEPTFVRPPAQKISSIPTDSSLLTIRMGPR